MLWLRYWLSVWLLKALNLLSLITYKVKINYVSSFVNHFKILWWMCHINAIYYSKHVFATFTIFLSISKLNLKHLDNPIDILPFASLILDTDVLLCSVCPQPCSPWCFSWSRTGALSHQCCCRNLQLSTAFSPLTHCLTVCHACKLLLGQTSRWAFQSHFSTAGNSQAGLNFARQ